MRLDSTRFPVAAKQTGFEAGNLEKVLRLRELLNEFHKLLFFAENSLSKAELRSIFSTLA